jgi:hypothetical protein
VRSAAYAVVIAAAMFLTGCTSAPAERPAGVPSQSFGASTSAVDEYEKAAKTNQLPEGQTYPEPSFAISGDTYESGYGTSEALRVWFCAWGKQYLATQGVDTAEASTSLGEFEKFLSTETFKQSYDPVSAQPLFKGAVENAKLGDPSGIQAIIAGSCG